MNYRVEHPVFSAHRATGGEVPAVAFVLRCEIVTHVFNITHAWRYVCCAYPGNYRGIKVITFLYMRARIPSSVSTSVLFHEMSSAADPCRRLNTMHASPSREILKQRKTK